MSFSKSAFVAININIEQDSHLMRLPTEIREMIYRHLLVAKYTMMEPNMTTKEYDCNRSNIQGGPDQTYHFDTTILGTNRKIYEEARDLCRRENNFICLTSRRPSRLGYELEERGLQMIAKGSKACGFWNISMTLTLDPAPLDGWPQAGPRYSWADGRVDASEDGRPWVYIFCSDELPKFCRLLLKMSKDDDSVLGNTALYLDINPAIGNGQARELDSNPAGLSRIGKLLNPLRQLHSLGAAQIQGPLSGSYKGEIIKSICKDCPTAMDIIHTAMVALNQADEEVSNGQLLQANLGYKAALSVVGSCCWRYDERDFVIASGPFPGLTALQNIYNIVVRLQARIAAVYFESGKLRMARIYTERALDPRRPYDDRHNKMYTLSIEPWQGVVYAEVLHVAAKISYTHGDMFEAKGALKKAGQLVPLNEEEKFKYEAWQSHADSLHNRNANKAEARKMHSQKQDEKTQGMFLVACNWKNKGDRLLRSGRSDLAASIYKTALSKIELIGQNRVLCFTIKAGSFEGYGTMDAINALRFKVRACLAAAYSMSRKHKDVGKSTDFALECSHPDRNCTHDCYGRCNHRYWDDEQTWREDQKLDYVKIHYCKALALKHMGDTVRAVESMEKALSFDPGDGTVYAQLVLLKGKLEEDAVRKRKDRVGKLNAHQDQLRKKQTKRRIKARG